MSPIERAAEALFEAFNAKEPTEGATYGTLDEPVKAELRWIATTVLLAVREPSEETIRILRDHIYTSASDWDVEDQESLTAGWSKAIDKLLEEGT